MYRFHPKKEFGTWRLKDSFTGEYISQHKSKLETIAAARKLNKKRTK